MLLEVVDWLKVLRRGELHHEMLFYCRMRDVRYV